MQVLMVGLSLTSPMILRYALHVAVLGEPVSGSPFPLDVAPAAADPAMSSCEGDGLRRAFFAVCSPSYVDAVLYESRFFLRASLAL